MYVFSRDGLKCPPLLSNVAQAQRDRMKYKSYLSFSIRCWTDLWFGHVNTP